MLDAHFHLPVQEQAEGILCTSRAAEWEEAFHTALDRVVPSLGQLPPSLEVDFPRLEALLAQREEMQIGEVGLDKRFPGRDGQAKVLQDFLCVARNMHRMVSLHVVGADGLMAGILDGTVATLWHGFTGSVETAKAITDKGVVISLGPRVERTNLWNRLREIQGLPFTVESDLPACGTYHQSLEAWYRKLAIRLGWEVEQVEAHALASLKTLLT